MARKLLRERFDHGAYFSHMLLAGAMQEMLPLVEILDGKRVRFKSMFPVQYSLPAYATWSCNMMVHVCCLKRFRGQGLSRHN